MPHSTRLLLEPVLAERSARLAGFAGLAAVPQPFFHAVDHMRRSLKRFWRLWENPIKEPYWRLVINGLLTGERMHQTRPVAICACGNGRSNREHHYWACGVAAAVVTAVTDGLQRWQPTLPGPLCASVWLMQTPRGVHQDLRDIVCLAAVAAMDHGVVYSTILQPQSRGGQQPRPMLDSRHCSPNIARSSPPGTG